MEEYASIVFDWVKNPQNWEGLLDSIAGVFGVTSANGRAFLGVGLVVAGIIILCLVIWVLWKAWRRFPLVKSDEILVSVSIPCGYFKVDFDLSDVEDKSYAGYLTQHYTPAQIRERFDENLPSSIKEFIEKHGLIAETKKAAETSIRSTVEGMIRNLV